MKNLSTIFATSFKKYRNPILLLSSSVVSIFFLYSLTGAATHVTHDEWVGRGLYPGLALAHGADLYEPEAGPHITLYGAGSALFYAPTALASTPDSAALLAFFLNLSALLLILLHPLHRLLSPLFHNRLERTVAIWCSTILILAVLAIEPTTEGLLRIHADLPAYFFLIAGVSLFDIYLQRRNVNWLTASCLALSLSIWAKIPTLPATLFPCLYLAFGGRFKDALLFAFRLAVVFSLTSACFFLAYGMEDTLVILFKHVQAASVWGDRQTLFEGPNNWTRMTYLEATPLLFRFLTMYLGEYWYLPLAGILAAALAFASERNQPERFYFTNFCIIYALTLPPCLAAVAHFGGVENSLLFANATGTTLLLFVTLRLLREQLPPSACTLLLALCAGLLLLPFVRQSRSAPSDEQPSANTQAFQYLKSGKTDVYFGWYPIAHLMHDGEILTSIEAPTWVGQTMPDSIDFSRRHLPPKAKYLATSPTGYGSAVLKQYLGELKEVPSPPELPSWRLFELQDETAP